MRRRVAGAVTALAITVVATLFMVPFRAHLSIATTALILVIPVVAGVAVGGFSAGVFAVAIGFAAYDWFFIPPYGTFSVGRGENWVALVVYAVVMAVVARVVAYQQEASAVASRRTDAIRQLFAVSEEMLASTDLDDLLDLVTTTAQVTFATTWTAVLLPSGGRLVVAATAGSPLTTEERANLEVSPSGPTSLTLSTGDVAVSTVALSTVNGPVGQLVVANAELSSFERDLLKTFANQAALAIERSQLREQALRTEMLEEIDRWRAVLVGAVSHDLRTPLASMKAAVSTLRDHELTISSHDRDDLLAMIEEQGDHLTRLVSNLLDAARLEAGTLVLDREPHSPRALIDQALSSLGTALDHHRVVVNASMELPLVDADIVLIAQVLANLVANAAQHGPEGSIIAIESHHDREQGEVTFTVSDEGPGIAPLDREEILSMRERRAGSSRAGLGLALSTAFIDAHGASIKVGESSTGGAAFSFCLPVADLDVEV